VGLGRPGGGGDDFARRSDRDRKSRCGRQWSVKLDPLKATSEPLTLTARGANTLTVKDLLVGEVWLASGQSNMEMQISGKEHGSVDHADEEIAAAKHPGIRMFIPDVPYSIYELLSPPAEPVGRSRGHLARLLARETRAEKSAAVSARADAPSARAIGDRFCGRREQLVIEYGTSGMNMRMPGCFAAAISSSA